MKQVKKFTRHKWLKFLAAFIMLSFVTVYSVFAQGWEASEEVILEHEEKRPFPNWREENVPDYVLPDLLGTATTANEWESQRRQEVLGLLWEYAYGQQLDDPENIAFSIIHKNNNAMDGAATLKRISITSTVAHRNHSFELIVFVPNNAPKPVPLLLLMNHRSSSNTDPTRNTKSDFWPAEEVIARGYGIASFQTWAVSPDDDTRFLNGAINLVEGSVSERPDDAPMMLSAWAWGAGRAMDYFETDTDIDVNRIGVVGHSRGGKASLLAGAQDQRIALAISNGSGCMGAALTKREFGERIHNINRKHHWFNEIFKGYNYKEPEFPVDQHMLIALMAPRPVYVSSADEDLWADPRGEFLGVAHASPVYELYGYNAVGTNSMPALNEPMHAGPRGYHIRPGKHDMTLYDWQRFMDFADKNLVSSLPDNGSEFIIDNVNAKVSFNGGFWTVTSGTDYYRDNFHTCGNDASKYARYAPDFSGREGDYEIFVKYVSGWEHLGTDCPYVVNHQNGQNEIKVDQTVNGGQWVSIGNYNMGVGDYVDIGAWLSNDKRPCVDAIKFVGGDVSVYTLTVKNGSGGGDYEEGEKVNISADTAPSGQEFDQWTGDVSAVADVYAASTTVTMPASGITVSATYKDIDIATEEFIIDDIDAEVSFNGGFWTFTGGTDYYGDNFHTCGNDDSKYARYAPDFSGKEGEYEIFVNYASDWWNLGTDCPYVVNHQSGQDEVKVDQTVNGGQWVSIGTYNMGVGDYVDIGAWLSNDKRPCVDAIKFVGSGGGDCVAYSQYRFTVNTGAIDDYRMALNALDVMEGATVHNMSDWFAWESFPNSMTVDFGDSFIATGIQLTTVWTEDRAPADFTLEGSNDGSSWTTIISKDNLTTPDYDGSSTATLFDIDCGGGTKSGENLADIKDDVSEKINIYPNPADDEVVITLPEGKHTIGIHTLQGVTVDVLQNQSGKAEIDVSGYSPGIYLVKINGGNNQNIKKLIIR